VTDVDVVVVGSGPNGLAAGVTMARAGHRVRVYETASTLGGGASSAALTLPGFVHDVCSAVHPLAFESRFFQEFGLTERVPFVVPELSYAHPLDGGRAALAYRSLDRTADELGRDGGRYARMMRPLVERASGVADFTGGTLLRIPPDPLAAVAFGIRALEQGSGGWNLRFRGEAAPAMVTGVAAHTMLHQPSLSGAGAGLALATYAHARGWPIPIGGTQAIADAMADDIRAHGGEIVTDHEITSLDEIAGARAVLLDVTPRAFAKMASGRLPARYLRALRRFRYGPGVAKVDFALSEPVPWSNPEVGDAAAMHLGGTRDEIAAAENDVEQGRMPERPYVLVAQPTRADPSRAPEGRHVLWAYTHVPSGSDADRQEAIVRQIERFAPGFRDTILAAHSRSAVEVARHNANYPGGDISAGVPNLPQLLKRPVLRPDPWRTPLRGIYLCSASTTPGPGVHGLAGWWAARSALRHEFGVTESPDLSPRRS
jgi:phytoene dehydrogenase-like protein